MAKAKTAHLVPYQFQPRAPAPIVITKTRTVHAKPKKTGKHRRHGGSSAITPERLMKIVAGGFVAGFAEKSFGAMLPTIPLLGRKGSVLIALYFIAKNSRVDLLKDATIAMAGISGYELGSTGKLSGEDLAGVASQV
jgi:hypothetical protein